MALDTSLLEYWKCDESSGTNVAGSLSAYAGTLSGTSSWGAGKLNNAFTLSASGSFFKSTISSGLSSSFTVAGWVKFTSSGTTEHIFNSHVTSYDNYWFMVNRNASNQIVGNMYDGTNNPNTTTTITVSSGVWTHIAFVRDTGADTISVYINGILGASTNDTTTSTPTYGVFGIGEDRSGTDRDFAGSIDEMGLWSRALSADEILQIANSGRGNSYPFTATPSLYGAVAFYNLDDSSGNAVDSTGNGYTLTNNNTITYTTGKINNCATLGTGNTNKYFSANVVDPDSYNSGFSISFWLHFNTVPSGSDNDIFEFQDTSNSGIFMRVNSSSSTTFRFGTGNGADQGQTTYTSSWSSGTWYHIAMVHNATSNTYYVNGSQVAQKTTGTITLSGNQSTINIGRNTANVNYSNARYDMFGIFLREISSTEVSALYYGGAGNQYPFAVAITFAISETLALVESISNLRTRLFSTSETITLTETISVLKGIAFTVAEALGLVETFTSTRTRLFTVAESMGLIEIGVTLRSKWNAITKSATATMDNVSKAVSNWINTIKN